MLRRRIGLSGTTALLAALVVAGCLSGGPPPTGRQLMGERTVFAATFYPRSFHPEAAEGATVLLVSTVDASGWSLHALSDPGASGGAISSRVLLHGQPYDVVCRSLGCGPELDSRGRLIVNADPTGRAGDARSLLRIDPLTAVTEELSPSAGQGQLSPSGQRLTYVTFVDGLRGVARLREADDREIDLGEELPYRVFIGEDLYFIDARKQLRLIPPGGPPRTLATDVTSFEVLSVTGDPLLFLTRAGDEPTLPGAQAVLNLATGGELALARELTANASHFISPDGRWLLLHRPGVAVEGGQSAFAWVDLNSGATQTFMLSTTPYIAGAPWRPGTHEAWITDGNRSWILRPDVAPVPFHRQLRFYQFKPEYVVSSPFTRDGSHFFTYEARPEGGPGQTRVVPVSDPSSPGIALNPWGSSSFLYQEVSDARLMVEAYYADSFRSDLFLVDLAGGASRLMGQAGSILAIDRNRMLSFQRCMSHGGCELSLVDLATGATQRLAEGVTSAVVEDNGSTDGGLAPGTRVLFIVAGVYPSPYDGLWLTTLP